MPVGNRAPILTKSARIPNLGAVAAYSMRRASNRGLNTTAYRLALLALVILGLWITSSATGVTARFGFESIRRFLEKEGFWGVLAFTVIFSAGQLLRVPGIVLRDERDL
jgi:hypothetical protein